MLNKYITTCTRCLQNEADVDAFLTPIEYRNNRLFPRIPRVSKWIGLWEKKKKTFLLLSYILSVIWFLGAGVLFLGVKHLVYLNFKRKFSKKIINKNCSSFVIFLEKNTISHVENSLSDPNLVTWIIPPKFKNEFSQSEAIDRQFINVESLVSVKDIFYSFAICVFLLYRLPFNLKLQLYAIPDCLLTRFALEKISPHKKFVCTAHFDRWAIMVNDFCAEMKAHYVLIQHGSVKGLDASVNKHFYMTNKLTFVKDLFVYDEHEYNAVLNYLISKHNHTLCIHYSKPLFLIDHFLNGDILFIGHQKFETIHIDTYKKLNLSGYKVFYKEHPKARATKFIHDLPWNVIHNENVFPKVKFVISYHSTLASMYEEAGTKVFIHDMDNINSPEYISFIKDINEFMHNYD